MFFLKHIALKKEKVQFGNQPDKKKVFEDESRTKYCSV